MKDQINNNKPIKGITKIELFNQNGELEYTHEEENVFSAYWANYFNNEVLGKLSSTNTERKLTSFINYMTLYNTDKTEREVLSNLTGEGITYLGIANLHSQNTSSDARFGNINNSLTEYGWVDFERGKKGIKYVCDFNAGISTGTFNTVSLNYNYSTYGTRLTSQSIPKMTSGIFCNNSRWGLKHKGNYIFFINNASKGENFKVLDKQFNKIRDVAPPVQSQYCTLLDLEPDNDDILYVQEFGSNYVYKWTISTDNFEQLGKWTYRIRNSFRAKRNGEDVVCLLYSTSDMSSNSKPTVFLYDTESKSIGESIGNLAGTGIYNVVDFSDPSNEGEYIYLTQHSYSNTVDFGLEQLLDSTFRFDTSRSSYMAISHMVSNIAEGSVKFFCPSYSEVYVYEIMTPRITVNKLSETVTKTEEQSMRITYTLEMDI